MVMHYIAVIFLLNMIKNEEKEFWRLYKSVGPKSS